MPMKTCLKLFLSLSLSAFVTVMPITCLATSGEHEELDETALEDLDETSLDIELIGTAPGKDDQSFAIILDNETRIQRICRKGDYIKGALVKKVYRDKILLSLDGENQLLLFADPQQAENVQAGTTPSANVDERPEPEILPMDPEVTIVRDEPSAENPDIQPRVRRIVFKNKKKTSP